MNDVEKMAFRLATANQIAALSDVDLSAVYRMVCNRKRASDRNEMVWKTAARITSWRRAMMRKAR